MIVNKSCRQNLIMKLWSLINFLPEDFYSHSQVDSIPVESSYDGPKLPSTAGVSYGEESKSSQSIVTMKFVHELISCFKKSKSLHKKYVLSPFLHNSECCIHSFLLCHSSRAHSLSAIWCIVIFYYIEGGNSLYYSALHFIFQSIIIFHYSAQTSVILYLSYVETILLNLSVRNF